MATIMTAEDAARDAVEGMRPNTSRIAHYYKFDVSAVQLVHEILRLPQVDSAHVVTCLKIIFASLLKRIARIAKTYSRVFDRMPFVESSNQSEESL